MNPFVAKRAGNRTLGRITPEGWRLRRLWRRFIVGATLIEGMSIYELAPEDIAPWISDLKRLVQAGVRFDPTFLSRVRLVERMFNHGDDDPDGDGWMG